MEVKTNVAGDVVYVEVTRTIKVGQLYKITPTEAYLGIEPGTARVTHIAQLADLVDISDDVASQANEFARQLLDVMDGEPYYSDEDERLRNQPWVVYQYAVGNMYADRSSYILPVEEFVVHTTQY